MKKFAVTFKEITTKTIEIEAEDRDEALEIADKLVCDPSQVDMEKNFDDWSFEIDELKEVKR